MDFEADERLLRENLHTESSFHIRRTLDQSYFLTMEYTTVRDTDQVVYRGTKGGKTSARNTRVMMVDPQLYAIFSLAVVNFEMAVGVIVLVIFLMQRVF